MTSTELKRAAICRLHDHLSSCAAGQLTKEYSETALSLLRDVWQDLRPIGSDGSLDAPNRLFDPFWNAPVLRFSTRSSSRWTGRAVLIWKIDIEKGTRVLVDLRSTFGRPRPVDIEPIAAELAPLIAGRCVDARLHWSRAGKVRVRTARVLPAAGGSTTHRRRQRLYRHLGERLAWHGWRVDTRGWWEQGQVIHDQEGDPTWKKGSVVRRPKSRPPAGSDRSSAIGRGRGDPGAVGRWSDNHNLDVSRPVGWICNRAGVGNYVLCFQCQPHRPVFGDTGMARGSARTLVIDEIRPQGQTCVRCGSVLVEGILPYLPDRYPLPGRRS